MANRWGISRETEELILKRDLNCVYCGISFSNSNDSSKSKPSWEQIINDIRIYGPENIALCCRSCNASKGAKELEIWLESKFCIQKGITRSSLAPVVLRYLEGK